MNGVEAGCLVQDWIGRRASLDAIKAQGRHGGSAARPIPRTAGAGRLISQSAAARTLGREGRRIVERTGRRRRRPRPEMMLIALRPDQVGDRGQGQGPVRVPARVRFAVPRVPSWASRDGSSA